MDILNQTPFSPFVYEFSDQDGDDHFIVIIRGTFRVKHGKALIPVQQQAPVVIADEYESEPLTSPLLRESDLCPVKLNTDIFVHGDAVAPGGSAKTWRVAVQTEKTRSELNVYCPRNWEPGLLGWGLSEPKSVDRIPLNYSLAYGGSVKDRSNNKVEYSQNPIGLGFSTGYSRADEMSIPAPQIECPSQPIFSIEDSPTPKCFSPTPKAWPQRLKLAGTYDDNWLQKRWPEMPEDFDAYSKLYDKLKAIRKKIAKANKKILGNERGAIRISMRLVRPKGVPKHWIKKPGKNGRVRYIDPDNPHNSVRVSSGDPNHPFPNSREPYVRWTRNGKPLDVNGNPLPTKNSAEAHIPLSDFEFKP